MASRLEEDLYCPICHDVFRDPVLLSCSHNFCKDCVKSWWKDKEVKECPLCKRRSSKFEPPCNLDLKNLCETFLQERDLGSSHALCSQHSKKLKFFCLDHQPPVCLVCRDSEKHTNHRIRSIDEAAQQNKKQLQETLEPLKEELQCFERVKVEFEQTAEHIKVQAGLTEIQIKEHAQSEITLEGRLGALQCHFTWDLEPGRSKLLRIKDMLQDIRTEEGCKWRGHIYNLQGYVHFKLGSIEEARSFFSRAAEAFRKMRGAEEGPWLVGTYGNQAWLHHHQGEQEESRACLSKIDGLLTEDPSQDELHQEICAEKAWTLMKFSGEQKLLAADYFQRAIRMQPDMVEWQTSHVLAIKSAITPSKTGVEADIMEKLRKAKEQDPENLYLAAVYLLQLAKRGETDQSGARELATKLLRNPVSSYSGIKPLMWFRTYTSLDEAVALAEEALKLHPEERYLKRCVSLSYKWKIWEKDSDPSPSLIEKGIRAYEDLLSLYPDSSFMKRMDLASFYAKRENTKAKSEKIFQQLLVEDLEPAEQQAFFNIYAKHLYFIQRQPNMSIQYHMKAAEIPIKSFFQGNSIKLLEKIRHRECNQDVDRFLSRLRESPK
ncbi:interferon-induced protein with tetratricopeptide repeats 1-like [Pleuronectes platessa]|uniref:interferon-induced protein with tetratricopeptide repeats 1-like n=1 Tax=Pleuronectes platessa TaxID=8262 RepID=UPI00232A6D03|nr:interferon-induced protein with tetratricopeptide repeats 1-like [Pleuronectes platessa]